MVLQKLYNIFRKNVAPCKYYAYDQVCNAYGCLVNKKTKHVLYPTKCVCSQSNDNIRKSTNLSIFVFMFDFPFS